MSPTEQVVAIPCSRLWGVVLPSPLILCGGAGVQWLVLWTSDLKVGGSTPSPCHRVVSLDKKLYSTLSVSTQVYKMGTGVILRGVTLRGTSIPSRAEQQYFQLLHATETRISPGRVSLLGSCATLPFQSRKWAFGVL